MAAPTTHYFPEEARRHRAAVAASPTEAEDQGFIDSVTDWPED